jgi:hypothetical protein
MSAEKLFVYGFISIFASTFSAFAQSESVVGRLTCDLVKLSESISFPEADLECEFHAASGGVETYTGKVSGIGRGLQVEDRVVFVWDAYPQTASEYEEGRLKGTYLGGSDAIELSNGILASELLSPDGESFYFLPVSFTGIIAGSQSVRIQLLKLR